MIKNYISKFVLSLLFMAFIFVQSNAQIRIVEVDPNTEAVTIHNFGGSTIDISSYQLCSLFSYGPLSGMTIVNWLIILSLIALGCLIVLVIKSRKTEIATISTN